MLEMRPHKSRRINLSILYSLMCLQHSRRITAGVAVYCTLELLYRSQGFYATAPIALDSGGAGALVDSYWFSPDIDESVCHFNYLVPRGSGFERP